MTAVILALALRKPFPEWEKAGELPESRVSMTFGELTHGEGRDKFTVNVMNTGDRELYYDSYQIRIDYLWKNGVYYTIYDTGGSGPGIDEGFPAHYERSVTCSVPAGLFDKSGEYRIHLYGLGNCGYKVEE